jgi:O-antigen/teichoic acid export membrane protein
MLIRHILSYFVSRGLTGIINFVAIALYTRMLTTADYGGYALIVATAGLVNSIFFQWIRLVILRFLSKYKKEKSEYILLSTLLVGYFITLVAFIFALSLFLLWDVKLFSIILGILFLTISQSIFDIISELLRASLQAKAYGMLSVLKSSFSLGLSLLLINMGLGANGVIVGLTAGSLLSLLALHIFLKRKYNQTLLLLKRKTYFDLNLLKECLKYGLPLTATLSLSFILNQSDRLLLGWMIGKSEAGIYSAAYDLTQQTIIMLMMIVNLASYPLCVRALENEGIEAAQSQVRKGATALLMIAVPATIGIVVLANSISSSILGAEFSRKAADIIPIVAISVLLQGMKSYYFDLSFQLGKKTNLQIWPVFAGGLINIILNLLFIPVYGVKGAVYATLVSYIIAIVLSGIIGRAVLPLSFPLTDFVKITVCAIVMAVPLHFLDNINESIYGLVVKVIFGAFIYFVGIYALNIWGVRGHLESLRSKIKLGGSK